MPIARASAEPSRAAEGTDRYFHETWLGMVQPIDGLVVSIPVLVDAQCIERQPPHVQARLIELCPPTRRGEAGPEGYSIANLGALLSELLGFSGRSGTPRSRRRLTQRRPPSPVRRTRCSSGTCRRGST